jgi:hypothetical protein
MIIFSIKRHRKRDAFEFSYLLVLGETRRIGRPEHFIARPCENRQLFCNSPVFVPSLSWQNDRIYT